MLDDLWAHLTHLLHTLQYTHHTQSLNIPIFPMAQSTTTTSHNATGRRVTLREYQTRKHNHNLGLALLDQASAVYEQEMEEANRTGGFSQSLRSESMRLEALQLMRAAQPKDPSGVSN